MKIVNTTTGDTGNQSYLLSEAINRSTPHESRSFVRKASNYLHFDSDVVYNDTSKQAIELYRESRELQK